MENTFEKALDYVHHLDQIDDGWSESERTLASAMMSYAAKKQYYEIRNNNNRRKSRESKLPDIISD